MKSSLIIAVFLCISSTYVEGQAFTWLTCAAKYANYTAQYQPWFGFSLVSSFSGAISTAAQCDNLASWVRYIDQYYIKSKPSCAGITCPQGQVCRARPAGLTVACSWVFLLYHLMHQYIQILYFVKKKQSNCTNLLSRFHSSNRTSISH